MAELKAKVSLNTKAFNVGLARMRRNSGRFANKIGGEFAKVGANLARLGTIGAAALAGLAFAGVKKNFALESLELQFATLLGSASAAKQRMAELVNFATSTPFTLEGIAAANKALEAAGQGGQDTLRLVGDAAAATGADFFELAVIMQKAFAKGAGNVALGEVIDQLNERALLSADAFLKLREESAKGISGAKSIKLITDELKKFSGAMESLSETGSGQLSTLKDNIFLTLAQITKGFADASKDGIGRMNDAIKRMALDGTFQNWGKNISATIKGVIGAWRSMASEQRDALQHMAVAGAGFVTAWKLGFVKPLITITAALVARMMVLLNPAVIFAGILGWAAFFGVAGLAINKWLEKAFDFSNVILIISAVGFEILDAVVAIFTPIINKIIDAGALIAAVFRGDWKKIEAAANEALKINLADELDDEIARAGDVVKQAIENIHQTIAAIEDFDPPKVNEPELTLADAMSAEFKNALSVALDFADDLRDQLAGGLGLDEGADALGEFLGRMKAIRDEQMKIPIDTDDVDKAGDAGNKAADAFDRLHNAVLPFRGGKILSLDIGAKIGKDLDRVKAKLDKVRKEAALFQKRPKDEPAPKVVPKVKPQKVIAPDVVMPDVAPAPALQVPAEIKVPDESAVMQQAAALMGKRPLLVDVDVDTDEIDKVVNTISTPFGPIMAQFDVEQPVIAPTVEQPIIEPKVKSPAIKPKVAPGREAAAALRSPSAANVGQMRGDFAGIGETLSKIHGTLTESLTVQKQIADSGVIMGYV